VCVVIVRRYRTDIYCNLNVVSFHCVNKRAGSQGDPIFDGCRLRHWLEDPIVLIDQNLVNAEVTRLEQKPWRTNANPATK